MQQVSKILLSDSFEQDEQVVQLQKQNSVVSQIKSPRTNQFDKTQTLRVENEESKQQNQAAEGNQQANRRIQNYNRQQAIQISQLELTLKQIEQNQQRIQSQYDNFSDYFEKQKQETQNKEDQQEEMNTNVQRMREELISFQNALFEIQKFTEEIKDSLNKTQEMKLDFGSLISKSKSDQDTKPSKAQGGSLQIQQLTSFVKSSISNYQTFQANTQKAIEKLEQAILENSSQGKPLPEVLDELQYKSKKQQRTIEELQTIIQKFQKENEFFMMERIPELLKKQNNFRDSVQQELNEMKAKLDEDILTNKLKWENMNESYDSSLIKLNTVINTVQKLQGYHKHQHGKQAGDQLDEQLPATAQEFKIIKVKVSKIEEAISKIQLKVKKATQEAETVNQNLIKIQPSLDMLSDLSIFQQQLNELIRKQNEGSKLNKQDNRTIKEIYEYLDCKMDKADLNNKVDKEDLKKVQRLLNRRIEEIKNLLKIQQREGTAPVKSESSAFAKAHQNMFECIACGTEYQSPSKDAIDFQVNSKMPKSRHQNYGPGFSRVLGSLRLLENRSQEIDLPEIYTSSIFQCKTPT